MFLRPLAIAALLIALLPAAVRADDARRLGDLLGFADIVEIMREEGVAHGEQLARESLPGRIPGSWRATLDRIYDTERMEGTLRRVFADALRGTDTAPLVAYFETPEAQRIIGLEVSARRAMVDPAVEAEARAAAAVRPPEDPRRRLVADFVETGDLVEANVAGALNGQFLFYRGMADGGGLEISEAEMIDMIWAQEEETRQDTREWLMGFLLLAHGPVELAALERYVDAAGTPAGQALNAALFAGFDAMFAEISYAMGRALAAEMEMQDL
ncbi:hypothetical protein [Rhodosalinus sp. 5P4]|uniref:hypothetical protein n=1 Tax=Rhodosalinus sp. 5P4 TaxID=3239196 RepID=UPI003524B5C2